MADQSIDERFRDGLNGELDFGVAREMSSALNIRDADSELRRVCCGKLRNVVGDVPTIIVNGVFVRLDDALIDAFPTRQVSRRDALVHSASVRVKHEQSPPMATVARSEAAVLSDINTYRRR